MRRYGEWRAWWLALAAAGLLLSCGDPHIVTQQGEEEPTVPDGGGDPDPGGSGDDELVDGDPDGASPSTREELREWEESQDTIIAPWTHRFEKVEDIEGVIIEPDRLIFPLPKFEELRELVQIEDLMWAPVADYDRSFLRRVTGMEHTDEQLVYLTRDAMLDEVILKIDLNSAEGDGESGQSDDGVIRQPLNESVRMRISPPTATSETSIALCFDRQGTWRQEWVACPDPMTPRYVKVAGWSARITPSIDVEANIQLHIEGFFDRLVETDFEEMCACNAAYYNPRDLEGAYTAMWAGTRLFRRSGDNYYTRDGACLQGFDETRLRMHEERRYGRNGGSWLYGFTGNDLIREVVIRGDQILLYNYEKGEDLRRGLTTGHNGPYFAYAFARYASEVSDAELRGRAQRLMREVAGHVQRLRAECAGEVAGFKLGTSGSGNLTLQNMKVDVGMTVSASSERQTLQRLLQRIMPKLRARLPIPIPPIPTPIGPITAIMQLEVKFGAEVGVALTLEWSPSDSPRVELLFHNGLEYSNGNLFTFGYNKHTADVCVDLDENPGEIASARRSNRTCAAQRDWQRGGFRVRVGTPTVEVAGAAKLTTDVTLGPEFKLWGAAGPIFKLLGAQAAIEGKVGVSGSDPDDLICELKGTLGAKGEVELEAGIPFTGIASSIIGEVFDACYSKKICSPDGRGQVGRDCHIFHRIMQNLCFEFPIAACEDSINPFDSVEITASSESPVYRASTHPSFDSGEIQFDSVAIKRRKADGTDEFIWPESYQINGGSSQAVGPLAGNKQVAGCGEAEVRDEMIALRPGQTLRVKFPTKLQYGDKIAVVRLPSRAAQQGCSAGGRFSAKLYNSANNSRAQLSFVENQYENGYFELFSDFFKLP